jgi:hypothetical protein
MIESQRYGVYTHAQTGKGRGPSVFRSIAESAVRIKEHGKRLGIPDTDMRVHEAVLLADGRFSPVMHDPEINKDTTLGFLLQIRRQMLLHELALREEKAFDRNEKEDEAVARVEAHRKEAEQSILPFVALVKEIDAAGQKEAA